MAALRPISDHLFYLTDMLPPQIEEIYEHLLWIRWDVEDMALDKKWSETLLTDAPVTNKRITTNPDGLAEEAQYRITASST